ncbi:protein kinase [Candidatus Uabimicrobium sp. HlEnr_7]|uniref:protein kinase domain-containing protein n=1 Tax=Candidatus Uabimicrobium helgolandensis TaxID=3095367 RepID=UPI0035588683
MTKENNEYFKYQDTVRESTTKKNVRDSLLEKNTQEKITKKNVRDSLLEKNAQEQITKKKMRDSLLEKAVKQTGIEENIEEKLKKTVTFVDEKQFAKTINFANENLPEKTTTNSSKDQLEETITYSDKDQLEKTITYLDKNGLEKTITYVNKELEKTISYDENSPEQNYYLNRFIGRYQVFEEIGSGGFGTVYRGLDPHLHREIALKTIHSDKLSTSEVEYFEKEARTLAKCNHPNIVQIYDVGKEGSNPYLVMEFINGPSLYEYIAKERTGKSPQYMQQIICSHMIGLVDALNYMHKHKMYHQDIKPNNIIVSLENNCPKLVDFGLAVNQTDRENSKAIIGTYAYMPPEKFERLGTPKMHDIYALGIVFFEMLTGRLAHPGSDVTEIIDHVFNGEVAFTDEEGIDQELQNICLKCIERDPQNRYQSLSEFYEALLNYSGNSADVNDYPYLSIVMENKKLVFPLTHKINFIGRTFTNHIVIPDAAISRSQAIIEIDTQVKIRNLSEVNTIQVGDIKLGCDEETNLVGHEIIHVGEYTFHYIPRSEISEYTSKSDAIKSFSQKKAENVGSQIDDGMWERTIVTSVDLNNNTNSMSRDINNQKDTNEKPQINDFIQRLKVMIKNFEEQNE